MFLEKTRQNIEAGYQKLMEELPEFKESVYTRIEEEETDIALLLKYLYTNMPAGDAADYPYELFCDFAKHGVYLYQNQFWNGEKKIPDEVFLDYVVFHRVNTEGLTACRKLFCDCLRERVSNKQMEEAILETNYWCAEEATYQATDDRTISAEAVYRSGIGRCGEESVFTVNALRSIGIPARQVYAHRWAHCDDNHAWVEVWCEGEWHFLGACEPEEILDRGWFIHASSRSMMINSRIFGNQSPDGDVIEKLDFAFGVNQLERYARMTELNVRVEDEQGSPVSGAEVRFELLNYAELVPIAYARTDENGNALLRTGKGSLFVSAAFAGKRQTAVVDTRTQNECVLTLGKADEEKGWHEFDMTAPSDAPVNTKKPSETQAKEGKRKFEAAVQKRLDKVAGFPKEEDGTALLLSRGNAEEIRKFIEVQDAAQANRALLLEQLSVKDYRDCRAEVLEEHLQYAQPYAEQYPADIFAQYVLNPRISREQMGRYRKVISESFLEEEQALFVQDPTRIWRWIQQNIREMNQREYLELVTAPAGCMRFRIGSAFSKKILFVAICRTIGIPARLDPITEEMQYLKDGSFVTVHTEPKNGEEHAQLVIGSGDDTRWVYMQNWTVARRTGVLEWKTLQVGEGYQGEITLDVEPGDYRIITSNRLPNGNQFASYLEFSLYAGETREIRLCLRKAELEDMLEKIKLEEFFIENGQGEKISCTDVTKEELCLYIWTEAGKEPTEHILNEIRERKEEFAALGNIVNLVLQEKDDLKDPTFVKTIKELPKAGVYFDPEPDNVNVLARRMYGDPDKRPFILVTDQNCTGIYSTGGYNVGTGDMLLRILNWKCKK